MDGTKLPTAFASGTVQYPQSRLLFRLVSDALSEGDTHPPRPNPTCSSRSTISSALYSPFPICRRAPLTLTSCLRASTASLGTTSPILTVPFATWPAKREFHCAISRSFSRRAEQRAADSFRRFAWIRGGLLSRRKLAKSRQPLTEIAYACGFRDTAHFSRTFHFRFGCTPSAASEGHISGNELMRHTGKRSEIA